MDARRASIAQALAASGLQLVGGLRPVAGDVLPELPARRPAAVVWIVGQAGSQVWQAFSSATESRDGQPDPMDRWSKRLARPLADALGGVALFPSDGPPWPPFLRWAQRASAARPSPLGLLIHPDWGLWHALRFALVLPDLAEEDAARIVADAQGRSAPGVPSDLCARCSGQPCLHACPVGAFTSDGYAVQDCADHLHGAAGGDCLARGCLARRACPVGAAHRYGPEHAAFHMAAFAANH